MGAGGRRDAADDAPDGGPVSSGARFAGPAGTRGWKLARAAAPWAGSTVVFLLLFRILPGRLIAHTIRTLPPRIWMGALAAYVCIHAVAAAKYEFVLKIAGARLGYRNGSRCYFAGLFGSLFLPSLVGGDVVRAALAVRLAGAGPKRPAAALAANAETGTKRTGGKASVLLGSLLDRLLDFTALALWTILAVLLIALDPARAQRFSSQSRKALLALGAAVAVSVAVAIFLGRLRPARRCGFRARRRMVRLRAAWRAIRGDRLRVGVAFAWALGLQLALISLSFGVAAACGLRAEFRDWLFAWPLAKLSSAIPVTQAGLGVREAALAAFLVPFGAPAAVAVAASLAWEVLVIGIALAGGAYAFGAEPLLRRSVRARSSSA